MSPCTSACRRPTPTQAHCCTCHRTFGGVRGFDRHRRGGRCVPPEQLGMVDRDGVWRSPMPTEAAARIRYADVERSIRASQRADDDWGAA